MYKKNKQTKKTKPTLVVTRHQECNTSVSLFIEIYLFIYLFIGLHAAASIIKMKYTFLNK